MKQNDFNAEKTVTWVKRRWNLLTRLHGRVMAE